MKKVLVHYFSGTGNSLKAAKQLAKEECLSEYEFTFHPMEKGQCNIKDYSMHIFFFPVYATSVPHLVRKYIHQMEDGNSATAIIISTNGKISTHIRDGYQGWALHQARLYLKLKHFDVKISDTLDLPHNITNVMPPRKENVNQYILTQGLQPITQIAQKIAEQKTYHRSIFPLNFLWSIPFGILYSIFGRRGFGKMFAADSTCTQCKICVNQCPAHIIKSNNKSIRWGWNCEGCMRCINSCPQKSIQTSTLRALIMLVSLVANPLNLLYPYVAEKWNAMFDGIGVHIVAIVYPILAFLILWVVIDCLFMLLSNFSIFRKIIGFGHTKFFGRYQAK